MVNGGRVNSWTCINFAKNVQDNLTRGFCHELAQMCQISGMEFSLDPVLHPLTARPDHVERALSARYHDTMTILQPQGKELDLLIVGGRDIVLVDALSRHIPLVNDPPTIIFSADVTHSHPGEDSSPSIAVVNASKAYFCHEGKSRTAWFTIKLQVTCEMGS
ncbi:hypothetical protein ZIOFF_000790 [Zingiber officinale]|uniref:Uncharacterized protein n=1 Tax=Zingiber officinale TaxID=94328 RepID=A0A8J5I103_ZINOF|nr:hypothetical protein ZIOFF_000790 [Zingiber officinale]